MSDDKEKITVIHSTPLSDMVGLIKELGFPAVVTLGMGYFSYSMMHDMLASQRVKDDKQIQHMQHQDEILERISKRLDSMETRLNP